MTNNNLASQTPETDALIRAVLMQTVLVGSIISMILYGYFGSESMSMGALLGVVFGVSNFIFLTKVVVKLLDQNYKRKSILGVLIILKMLFIIGFLVLSFMVLKTDPVGFILGYGSLIPVVFIHQIRQQLKQA